jgi:hypothetical protein
MYPKVILTQSEKMKIKIKDSLGYVSQITHYYLTQHIFFGRLSYYIHSVNCFICNSYHWESLIFIYLMYHIELTPKSYEKKR